MARTLREVRCKSGVAAFVTSRALLPLREKVALRVCQARTMGVEVEVITRPEGQCN